MLGDIPNQSVLIVYINMSKQVDSFLFYKKPLKKLIFSKAISSQHL
jgi:hypothetical protein